MVEPYAIVVKGYITIDAGHHVGPVAGQHLAVGGFLKVKHVEGLRWICNHVRRRYAYRGRRAGFLSVNVLGQKSGDASERSDNRAARQEL
jgi:hypothetical protein